MLKKIILFYIFVASFFSYAAAEPIDSIVGFWMTINDKTDRPSSVIAIYPYEGQYYGRILGCYNEDGVLDDTIYHPVEKTPGVVGHPYYSGLDLLWTTKVLKEKASGYIIDPEKGKKYKAKVWRKGTDVKLQGQVFVFSGTVTWSPFPETGFTADFPKPDVAKFVPKIPEVY